jgi:hypothetical protein
MAERSRRAPQQPPQAFGQTDQKNQSAFWSRPRRQKQVVRSIAFLAAFLSALNPPRGKFRKTVLIMLPNTLKKIHNFNYRKLRKISARRIEEWRHHFSGQIGTPPPNV